MIPSEDRLLPFRDVFEVNGKPVRNREDRLTKLFLQPPATAVAQATAIMAESARYHIGPERNVIVPVLLVANTCGHSFGDVPAELRSFGC